MHGTRTNGKLNFFYCLIFSTKQFSCLEVTIEFFILISTTEVNIIFCPKVCAEPVRETHLLCHSLIGVVWKRIHLNVEKMLKHRAPGVRYYQASSTQIFQLNITYTYINEVHKKKKENYIKFKNNTQLIFLIYSLRL